MNFEEFWAKLSLDLKVQEFATLKWMMNFEVVMADLQTVTVTPISTRTKSRTNEHVLADV